MTWYYSVIGGAVGFIIFIVLNLVRKSCEDRFGRDKIFNFFILGIFVLHIADVWTTNRFLQAGEVEGNRIMAYLMGVWGFGVASAFKILLVALILLFLYFMYYHVKIEKSRLIIYLSMLFQFMILLSVVVWNYIGVF